MAEYTRVEVELPTALVKEIRRLIGPGDIGFSFMVEAALQRELEEPRELLPSLSEDEAQDLANQAVREVRRERAAALMHDAA